MHVENGNKLKKYFKACTNSRKSINFSNCPIVLVKIDNSENSDFKTYR